MSNFPEDVSNLFKDHSITGGLASPPDSRYNSPIFPIGSSSNLQRGNLSPLRCVDPRQLQSSYNFFKGNLEHQEENNSTEQEIGNLGGANSQLTVRSRNSSTQPSSPPATSEHGCGTDREIPMELDKGGSTSTKDDSDSDDVTMPDLQLKESSSHPQDDDATMVGGSTSTKDDSDSDDVTMPDLQLKESLSHPQDDDATMVGTQSKESSLPPLVQDDDVPMVSVEPRERSSEPQRVEGVNFTRPTDEEMEKHDSVVVVESVEQLSEPKGPDSSDSEEDDEEGAPANDVKKIPDTSVGIKEATLKTGRKSNDISLDVESSVHTAAQFEPRRSSRNVSKKANYVQYVPPHRSFHRKKPASEKEEVNLLQASLPILPFNKLINFF